MYCNYKFQKHLNTKEECDICQEEVKHREMRVHKLTEHGIHMPEVVVGGKVVLDKDGNCTRIQCKVNAAT